MLFGDTGSVQVTGKDHETFVRLMSSHQRQVWWFINTLLPSESDADDVLQETSLVLWRKWDQFDRDRDFLSWAIGIARRQVLRYVREHRSKRLHLDEVVLGEIAEVAEKRIRNLSRVETRVEALKACIESLGEKDRGVVEARYLCSWSTKEIAEKSGKPLATVYTVLARARVQLANCVKRRLSAAEATG